MTWAAAVSHRGCRASQQSTPIDYHRSSQSWLSETLGTMYQKILLKNFSSPNRESPSPSEESGTEDSIADREGLALHVMASPRA